MAIIVTSDQKDRIGNRLGEIMRQVFLQKEYGHDPEALIECLQAATEGRFNLTQPTGAEKKIFAEWCAKWREFWEMFNMDVLKIMSSPNFPKQPLPGFPWVIVDPGLMDDEQLAKALFEKVGIPYWVSVALLEYSNSAEPKAASAILVRNTIEPDKEHLGKSADDADKITETKGTQFLLRRHWVILFAFLWWITKGKQKLDVNGWTRFPRNRLAVGFAAGGLWNSGGGKVLLRYCSGGGRQDEIAGPREGNFFTL